MIRTLVLGSGALALGLGLAAGSGVAVAGAAKTPVQMTGPISCSAIAAVAFSPSLTNAGSGSGMVSLVAKVAGCSGAGSVQGGVTLTGGKLVATGALPPTSCGAILGGSSLPTMSGTVTWKGSGGHVVSSMVTITGADLFYNAGADTLSAYVTNVSISSGSYSGEHMEFSNLASNKDAYKVTSVCGTSGIRSVKFGTGTGVASVGA